MARDENAPFVRGATWYDGATPDSADLGGAQHLGKEWVFEDIDPGTGLMRTNEKVRCRAVRNTSGINLEPARLASFSVAAGEYGINCPGYVTGTALEGYPIDEYLPAAGVVDDDIFWMVIEGPARIKTSLAGAAVNVIGNGSIVVAATAATSQATTAGRIEITLLPTATTGVTQARQVLNRIGRALTAATTANTGEVAAGNILVNVGKW